ncbi:MAG: hypothetical protein IPL32_19975 [Chloracidobacterium sp.]|nr:hypothetical protein [Chloracidobacterium sp.]
MTATTRTIEPTVITTREEVQWTKSYDDYPATLWQLNYYFRGPGVGFNAAWGTEVVADGSAFDITVPATKTVLMTVAGWYTWQAWLTEIADSTNKIRIGQGRTRVILGFDPTSTATIETRSTAKQIIDSIDAGMLTSDGKTVEYQVSTPSGSKKVVRASREETMKTRDKYAAIYANELAAERSRNGKPIMQTINMRVYDE